MDLMLMIWVQDWVIVGEEMILLLEHKNFQLVITILQHSFYCYSSRHLLLQFCDSRLGSGRLQKSSQPVVQPLQKSGLRVKTSYARTMSGDPQLSCRLTSCLYRFGLHGDWRSEVVVFDATTTGMIPRSRPDGMNMSLNVYMNTWLFREKLTWSTNPFYWSR